MLPIPVDQLKTHLVEDQLIQPEKFDALVAEAERKNQNIADILTSEHVATQSYLYNIFAKSLGVGLASLGERKLDENTVGLLSENVAREREVIVFAAEADGTLDVAMADPSDLGTIEFLRQNLHAKIKPFLASPDDLRRGFSVYGSRLTGDFKELIEKNIQESLRRPGKGEEAAADLPIVEILNNILSYAMSLRSSDIHLEALEENTLVRYRVDGILYEIIRIPKSVHPAIVARIKLLSGLKIDEHYEPQDGRFRYKVGNQIIDVRVSVMPTYYGEKIVMRLLEASQKPLSLEEIGLLPRATQLVSENLKKSYGMLLISGPTGSGKTTTLYAIMNILNQPNVNVASIEDPIEYNMRYVNQSQVNAEAGISFAAGLRALLRQDPNIIMVGEIRDSETANISVQAALTGHLLLSSIHTNDAPTAVPRLLDLDVPPFLLASTLNMIIAQRLVRKICTNCIYSYDPGPEFEEMIRTQFKRLGLAEADFHVPKVIYRGKGCAVCGGTGYRGRLGIFEIMEVTEPVREVITSLNLNLQTLQKTARAAGMRSMFEDGLEKVELALTTIDEVMRVIQE